MRDQGRHLGYGFVAREAFDRRGIGETRPTQAEALGLDDEGVVDSIAGKHGTAPSRPAVRRTRNDEGEMASHLPVVA